MNSVAFDAAARRAAAGVSRRGALGTLAGAGLAAALAPLASAAKKKGNKGKKKGNKGKKANAKCQDQAGQCIGWLDDYCDDEACDPEGEEQFRECCQLLGQCNAYGFWQCITA